LTEEEVRDQIQPIRDRLQAIENQIDSIEPQIADQPDLEQIKRKSKLARAVVADALKHPGPKAMQKMLSAPYEKQRAIIEKAFSGKDREGNRLGVYVEQTGDPKRPWKFEIRAVLDQIVEIFADNSIKSNFVWSLREPNPL